MRTTGLSRRATLGWFGIATLAFLGLALVLMMMTRGASSALHVTAGGVIIGLSCLFLAVVTGLVLKRRAALDEMEKEGQKWTFYWGTVAGLAISGPLIMVIIVMATGDGGSRVTALLAAIHLPAVLHAAFGAGLAVGALAIVVPLALGQLIMFGIWWWKHR